MSKCRKCGLPIHRVNILKSDNSYRDCLVHENYKEAWKVDEKGYAHALHFAEPEER